MIILNNHKRKFVFVIFRIYNQVKGFLGFWNLISESGRKCFLDVFEISAFFHIFRISAKKYFTLKVFEFNNLWLTSFTFIQVILEFQS